MAGVTDKELRMIEEAVQGEQLTQNSLPVQMTSTTSHEELYQELLTLKPKILCQRAKEAGVEAAKIEAARDGHDPKGDLIQLIITAAGNFEVGPQPEELRPATNAAGQSEVLPGVPGNSTDAGADSAKPHPPQEEISEESKRIRRRTKALFRTALTRGGYLSQDPEVRKMRDLFDTMDADGSGKMDKKEVRQLVRSMGDRMSAAQLDSAMDSMDKEMTGEVDFDQFQKWWRYKKQEYRREIRKKIQQIFDMVDEDGSGELNLAEVKLIHMRALKKLPGTIEFDPPFHLEQDFEMMQNKQSRSAERTKQVEENNDGETVNFAEFEEWFKIRTGDDDAVLPVLPEYMVSKIQSLSATPASRAAPESAQARVGGFFGSGTHRRSGKELWAFLRPRLQMLVKVQEQWGSIHDVYGTGEVAERERNTQIPPSIVDPDSEFSSYWDIAQMFALMYVAYAVPLRTAFNVNVVTGTIWFFTDLIVDIYFIMDVGLSFRTAFWTASGVLEVKKKKIAERYLKSWFVIDFISSLPLNYIWLIDQYVQHGSVPAITPPEQRSTKTIRLLRLGKLLRLARLKRLVQKYQDTFDFSTHLRLTITIFAILFASHMMSCVWYMLGTTSTDTRLVSSVGANGTIMWTSEDILGWAWVEDTWCGEEFDQKARCVEQLALETVDLGTRYSRSIFNIFMKEGSIRTTSEALFAVISEIVIGFIYGALAGVMSSLMMSGGAAQEEHLERMKQLKSWMKDKQLPRHHRVRIQNYFNSQMEKGKNYNEPDILASLPVTMASQVSYQMYNEVLVTIPVFRGMGKELMTKMCTMVRPQFCVKDQVIYEQGLVGSSVYFILDGEVEVSVNDERLGFLAKGAFFGEQPIIEIVTNKGGDGSELRSRTIKAACDTSLGVIDSADVLELIEQYPELPIRLGHFVKAGAKLSTKGNNRIKMTQEKVNALLHAAEAKFGAENSEVAACMAIMKVAQDHTQWDNLCERLRILMDSNALEKKSSNGDSTVKRAPVARNKSIALDGGHGGSDGSAASTNVLLRDMMASQASLASQMAEVQLMVKRLTVRINHATG